VQLFVLYMQILSRLGKQDLNCQTHQMEATSYGLLASVQTNGMMRTIHARLIDRRVNL